MVTGCARAIALRAGLAARSSGFVRSGTSEIAGLTASRPPLGWTKEDPHAEEVWEEGRIQGAEGDARTEAGDAQVRPLGEEGEEPQAGHRDRPVRGASSGRQGSEEEVHPEQGETARLASSGVPGATALGGERRRNRVIMMHLGYKLSSEEFGAERPRSLCRSGGRGRLRVGADLGPLSSLD